MKWHDTPDWKEWRKKLYLDPWECTALAHNLAPETYVKPEWNQETAELVQRALHVTLMPEDLKQKYYRVREKFGNSATIHRKEFAEWAIAEGWPLPIEFKRMAGIAPSFYPEMCARPLGAAALLSADLRSWLKKNGLALGFISSYPDEALIHVESLLCDIEGDARTKHSEGEAATIVSTSPRLTAILAENEKLKQSADEANQWFLCADAGVQWRERITRAAEAGELALRDYASGLPFPDVAQSEPRTESAASLMLRKTKERIAEEYARKGAEAVMAGQQRKAEAQALRGQAEQKPEAASKALTRPAIRKIFSRLSAEQWRGRFSREDTNGLGDARIGKPRKPKYDLDKLTDWLISNGLYTRAEVTAAIEGGSEGKAGLKMADLKPSIINNGTW